MTLISWLDGSSPQFIEVDATLSETHNSEAEVTEDPVEEGANATDNVRRKSRTLNLELFVADQYKSGGALAFELGRAERVFGWLERFEKDGTRLTITLGGKFGFGRVYENMVVQSARTTRTAKERDALTISAAFKEIRIASSEIVAAQTAKEPKGKKKITGGDQNTAPVGSEDDNRSLLYRGFNALGIIE